MHQRPALDWASVRCTTHKASNTSVPLCSTSNRIQSFFQELPPEISHLEHLQRLDVSSNLLSYLPSQIGDCFRLIELDVSSNRISDLPVDVGRLFRLNVS